jgi:hypothetical protein
MPRPWTVENRSSRHDASDQPAATENADDLACLGAVEVRGRVPSQVAERDVFVGTQVRRAGAVDVL